MNSENDILISGQFQETIDFDPGQNTFNLTSNGHKDAFLLNLDSNGNFLSAFNMGGSAVDAGVSVAVDNQDAVILGGTLRLTVDFQPRAGINSVTSNGDADAFVIKFNNLILGTIDTIIFSSEILAYPNPTNGNFTVALPEHLNDVDVTIYNTVGQVVFNNIFQQEKNIELSFPETSGVYFCTILIEEVSKTFKMTKK
ncbi:hypothetical protein ULMS_25490 [Patiriisocius marinistellae]|uniref:Secretion system C-terminal sorting domain-containing protein n=1 Tax=Patiriisocius marinistellae TaxID=2494560 RepID=A0A5J4G3S7_9FLAO|nr:T9SS type A sorting domain-containing protein [Patiriisocius marinistellae]GEQ87041.1 hypothetical protein ULMS_25490 [Patiriisocius marinistellae]